MAVGKACTGQCWLRVCLRGTGASLSAGAQRRKMFPSEALGSRGTDKYNLKIREEKMIPCTGQTFCSMSPPLAHRRFRALCG